MGIQVVAEILREQRGVAQRGDAAAPKPFSDDLDKPRISDELLDVALPPGQRLGVELAGAAIGNDR